MDDDDIRAALHRGDTNVAFRLLLQKHGPAVYSRCCRILRSRGAAEDVMQQAMIAAFKNRNQLLEVDQIRGWLIRVATRKSLDALRSSKRVDRLHHDLRSTDAREGDDLVAQLGTTQERRTLEECLASLPPELAAAVLMRYRDGMSWDQIAEAVGLPPDTIRMRVQRSGLSSLRDCLASKEDDVVTAKPPPDDNPGVVERLEAGEPPGSPEEVEARAPYERLFRRIRDLDDIPPSAGWEDRAMRRWRAETRQRRLGLALAATAAVGLAAALLLRPCSSPTQPGLEVAVLTEPSHPRRGDPAVGSLLQARARVDRAHVELRVYLGTKLVVRCPGAQVCRSYTSVVELEWQFVDPGSYQIVVLSSAAAIPPPSEGGIDRDLLEARNAGTTIESRTVLVTQ